MITNTKEMVWREDGHAMVLELNRSEVVVVMVRCPNDNDGPCRTNRNIGCIVEFFLMRFGFECNVGVCPASSEIPIAWTVVGDPSDVDTCQVWVVPVADDVYGAWAATMRA